MEQEIIVLDSQRLKMIKTCAAKYDNVFNRKYIPITRAVPLERGSAIHIMLDRYNTLRKYRDRWGIQSVYNPHRAHSLVDIVKICIRVFEHAAIKMDLAIEECDDMIRVFKEYVEYYQNEPHETLAVEEVGSKVLYESPELVIIYETKIDWITRLHHIPVLPWDHKTYSRRGPMSQLDDQFIGYCWMLNVLNIGINRIGFQTTVAPKDKFLRPIFSYPQRVIDGWVQNTIWWVMQLREHYRTGIWPLNETSCDKYSGCPFQLVCMTEPNLRDWKARSLFDIGDQAWDVGANL
jgi:hypothetical protein